MGGFQTGQIVKMWCVNSDSVKFKIKCHNNCVFVCLMTVLGLECTFFKHDICGDDLNVYYISV